MSLPQTAGHELQDLIGGGSVGAVYRAIGTGGKACAVKVFSSMAINRKGLGLTLRALQAMPAIVACCRCWPSTWITAPTSPPRRWWA